MSHARQCEVRQHRRDYIVEARIEDLLDQRLDEVASAAVQVARDEFESRLGEVLATKEAEVKREIRRAELTPRGDDAG